MFWNILLFVKRIWTLLKLKYIFEFTVPCRQKPNLWFDNGGLSKIAIYLKVQFLRQFILRIIKVIMIHDFQIFFLIQNCPIDRDNVDWGNCIFVQIFVQTPVTCDFSMIEFCLHFMEKNIYLFSNGKWRLKIRFLPFIFPSKL